MSPKLPPPAPVSWSENRYSEAQMLAMYHQGRREAFEEAVKVCDVTPPEPFRASIEAAYAIRALAEKEPK